MNDRRSVAQSPDRHLLTLTKSRPVTYTLFIYSPKQKKNYSRRTFPGRKTTNAAKKAASPTPTEGPNECIYSLQLDHEKSV